MRMSELIAALAVLAVGVLIAVVAAAVVGRLLKQMLPDNERGRNQRRTATRGTFAIVLLLALAGALSVLAPRLFADIPRQVLGYLPNLAVALLLLGMGAVFATLVEQLVAAAFERVGVPNAAVLAKVAYWIIFGLAIILAADQLGVQTAALQRLLLVVLLVAGVATALAVGMGGTRLAGSVIAGRYVEERFHVGDRIEVEDLRGTIRNVGLASTSLETDNGDTIEVPHSYLLDRPVRRFAAAPASGSSESSPSAPATPPTTP
jgi:small-conductance mechanosensitive channel